MSSIYRPAHVLKREKTLTIPRHYIFFDTETVQDENADKSIRQRFKLGWAVSYTRQYGRHRETVKWFYFDSVSAFWEFVFEHALPKQKLWVIARNIVFDFTVCSGWDFLRREGYKLKFFHNNGVSVIVSVTKGSRSIVFLDSMNWFVESLEETGKRIGIPKLKINFATCTEQELSIYCRNDVFIEFENFKRFIAFLETNSISRLCYTRASTAMAAYLFRHYHTPIYIHNNGEAIKLERESYKGGRCECFYLGDFGDEKYYILDVNSLYPYVMRNNSYPIRYREIKHSITTDTFAGYLQGLSVVAKVRLETDEPVYPVKIERTIFPIGTFETTLCTPELKYALEHNHIKDVISVVTYEQAMIFTSYVDTLYRLRREFADKGNAEYTEICKKLLNSLYGKFGQKAENWEKIGDAPDEPDREELIFYTEPRRVMRLRYLLGEIFELKGYSESFNSFPAIAAHVTAFARMHLWSLMQLAGIGNYFYCDTDSLIVNETGLHNLSGLLNDTEIGKLKVQERTTHLVIHGLKDYETDAKTVIKGIRKNAVAISDTTYEQQKWPTFKGILKTGDSSTYTVTPVIKHLTREYTKGKVDNVGKVTPFIAYDSYDILLSELLPIKKIRADLEQQILSSDIYQNYIESKELLTHEIGYLGLYYIPKKYRGEVRSVTQTYPALKFHITYKLTDKAISWDKAVQEGLLQRTGGTHGEMDISEFLARLGQAVQRKHKLGKIDKEGLKAIESTNNPYDIALVIKYTMLTEGHTVPEINNKLKELVVV